MRHFFVLFCIFSMFGILHGQEKLIKKLTLNEVIDIGLKNNPDIKSAKENISAAKGKYLSGISLPQPEINYNKQWIPTGKNAEDLSEKNITISQNFEFPTVYFLKGNKFGKSEEIARSQFNFVEKNLTRQIKTAYFKVLLKKLQVKTAEENLLISDDFYKKADIRLNVGEGTNLEKLTAKVQNSEAFNNQEIVKNELKTAYSELFFIIGYENPENEDLFDLSDSLLFVNYENEIKSIHSEYNQNPNIKIAELNTQIASIDKSLAVSSYLPKIYLAYQMQSRDNNSDFYGVSVGITLPLWFMFEQKGKVMEADANFAISEYELQQTKNSTALKLKNAIIDFENNLKQVNFYNFEILPQSEEIFRIASKSYDAGEITYIGYLQAKQTLIGSRNNYNNSLFNYFQSIFTIEEIIGKSITSK